MNRDVGSGLLPARDDAAPRLALLGSPTALALRSERGSLTVWAASVGVFALIIGVISKSISAAGISKQLQRELAKVGASSVTTPKGYIGFTFIFFVLAISMFVCTQIAAARHEEADQRLETLLALPVARRGWLGGRLALAAGAAVGIALVAGLLVWVGARHRGRASPVRADARGRPQLPAGRAPIPRDRRAGVRAGAPGERGDRIRPGRGRFLWQLFGSLLGAPKWLVDATPFAHVGLVPAAAFRPGAGGDHGGDRPVAAAAAVVLFERRDLLGLGLPRKLMPESGEQTPSEPAVGFAGALRDPSGQRISSAGGISCRA